jgi:dolichol kinase
VDAARKRLWLRTLAGVVAVVVVAVVFSAYLKPDMVAAFSDIMALCASLIR